LKIRLKDIHPSQLNNDCLRLVMKFSRTLKAKQGVMLKIQDKDILIKISDYAKSSGDDELKVIYQELKEHVKKSVYNSIKKSD